MALYHLSGLESERHPRFTIYPLPLDCKNWYE